MFPILLSQMTALVNPALIFEYAVPCNMSFESAKKLIMSIKHREVNILRAYTSRINRVLMHIFIAQRYETLLTDGGLNIATFKSTDGVIKFDEIDIQIKYTNEIHCTEEHYTHVQNALRHDLHRKNLLVVIV